jgi:hypothetical protein
LFFTFKINDQNNVEPKTRSLHEERRIKRHENPLSPEVSKIQLLNTSAARFLQGCALIQNELAVHAVISGHDNNRTRSNPENSISNRKNTCILRLVRSQSPLETRRHASLTQSLLNPSFSPFFVYG